MCLTLSRADFNSLLGPLETIMKRNMEEYEKPEAERNPLGHKMNNNVCKLEEFKTVGIYIEVRVTSSSREQS